jgi:hypothetical protein
MKRLLSNILFPLAVGLVLAQFCVQLYNHWYFAENFWLKTGLLSVPLALLFGLLASGPHGRIVQWLGCYWLAAYLIAVASLRSFDLGRLNFTHVLDYESAIVWLPATIAGTYSIAVALRHWRAQQARHALVVRELSMRRRLRERSLNYPPPPPASPPAAASGGPESAGGAGSGWAVLLAAAGTALLALSLTSPLCAQEDPEPQKPYDDRHAEHSDPALKLQPDSAAPGGPADRPGEPEGLSWGGNRLPGEPPLPGIYPTPAHLREREVFHILIDNHAGGLISAVDRAGQTHELGHVLASVANVNRKGFTASGWATPGQIAATAVNAIHIKTDQDYAGARGVIFSLEPLEFTTFNPANYKSYFNQSSSLFTDIPAGQQIFGGQWAPLIGSRVGLRASGQPPEQAVPLPPGYVPQDGDQLVIRVERLKYNPEWIEFENRFGGIIWIKEIGLDAYPIGQVLKPVVGVGRFLGTQYADVGRIRANHPGVIDISTSPLGEVGGIQIIPRDHAMSSEMVFARTKTQWMVIGPLWALDPSWEGLPPLFSDYLYPAFNPMLSEDGSVNEAVNGAAAFLSRFTVRARYSDDADPAAYVLLHPAVGLNHEALKTLTHLRIYFPRDSKL